MISVSLFFPRTLRGESWILILTMPRRLDELLKVDQVAGSDVFYASGLRTSWGRLFGGQILGQAVVRNAFESSCNPEETQISFQVAMEKTVKSEFLVHSLHAYFLLAGDSRKKILYTVERIHDGRSFCRRRVTGKQDNRAIFVVTASFKTAESEPKLEYQIPSTEMLALLSYFDVPRGGTYRNLVFFSQTII